MAADDDVWAYELDDVLRSAGMRLTAFAQSANVYERLDAPTRAVVDRVAARVPPAALVFHRNQAAIALLGASSRGPAEFAALLSQMENDVPASWLSRTEALLSYLSADWAKTAAVAKHRSPARSISLAVVLDEIHGAGDTPRQEARSILLERYRALDVPGARAVCDRALALRAAEPHLEEECVSILERATCVVPGALDGKYLALLEAGILYPTWLFRGADDASRDFLIRALETEHPEGGAGHAVGALAWMGGEVVAQTLARWSSTAEGPAWRRDLHVPPRHYAMEAGWWLSEDGARRALVTQACRRLVPESTRTRPVVVFAPAAATCPGCKGPLSFAVDLGPAELELLGHRGSRLRILTCAHCTAFAPVYCEVTLDGSARWSRHSKGSRHLPDDDWPGIAAQEMWLTGPVAPTEALARVANDQCQLGGYPSWEQDAEYPDCPACARPMPNIGQLAMEPLSEAEGFIYLFLDAGCGFAATTFQQT